MSQTVPENSAAQTEAASETAKIAREATYQLSPEDATLADVGVPVTPLPDHPNDFLISLAADERDIGRCYGVMAQLRPLRVARSFISIRACSVMTRIVFIFASA